MCPPLASTGQPRPWRGPCVGERVFVGVQHVHRTSPPRCAGPADVSEQPSWTAPDEADADRDTLRVEKLGMCRAQPRRPLAPETAPYNYRDHQALLRLPGSPVPD